MPPSRVFVDANLLVLLVVGKSGRDRIGKHRRTKSFRKEDYDRLEGLVRAADRVLVTPNTLTEASNLLSQHGEPERSRLLEGLRRLIETNEEVVVASATAARNREFERLGLTDAVLLESVSAKTPLLTVDLALYRAAEEKEAGAAYNFRNEQFR